MIGEPLPLPPEYGTPSKTLAWADVEARLEAATRVWLATVRPDGRPHTVPVDGLWQDGAEWFGGQKHGYAPPAEALAGGVWRLRPAKVLAWTSPPVDATRFRFDG